MSTNVISMCPIRFSPPFSSFSSTRGQENLFSKLTMEVYSSSEDELEMMGMVAAILTIKKKKKRKHKVWVKEIFQNRKKDGIQNLVNVMRVSNRDCYFK